MDLHDTVVDGKSSTTLGEDDRLVEVRSLTLLLGVDSHHAQLPPDLLQQNVKTQLHVDRNARIDWISGDVVYLFNGDRINFIVDVDTLDVLSSALDHVNELIDVVVSTESYVSIVHLVLVQDILNHFLVDFSAFHCLIELDTACFLRMDRNVGLTFV